MRLLQTQISLRTLLFPTAICKFGLQICFNAKEREGESKRRDKINGCDHKNIFAANSNRAIVSLVTHSTSFPQNVYRNKRVWMVPVYFFKSLVTYQSLNRSLEANLKNMLKWRSKQMSKIACNDQENFPARNCPTKIISPLFFFLAYLSNVPSKMKLRHQDVLITFFRNFNLMLKRLGRKNREDLGFRR